jgi:chemotaxis regulatin CheY-phosphate phosphatase CheZ
MPDVSKQLSSVTQATESATVEILNVLEAMTATVTSAQISLASAKKNHEASSAFVPKLHELITAQPEGELHSVWQQYASVESNETHMLQIEQALASTSEQSMSIAMALQVQDITSQQIAGATHLIEQVENQLQAALDQFESPEEARKKEATSSPEVVRPHLTFDSGATYTKDATRQQEADEITKQFLGK